MDYFDILFAKKASGGNVDAYSKAETDALLASKMNDVPVTADDNGEVLTVIEGQWGKALPPGYITFNSFKDLQRITRQGLADKVLAIGDQLVCERMTAMNATVGNSQGNQGITAASVDKNTFIHAIGTSHNGDYEFYWDGAAWHYNSEAVELTTYGITITGTPALGDEIVIHETAASLVWDVIGIDKDIPADPQFTHSVTLQLHDCFAELQFCARQALFAFPEGLAAGTYHFKLTAQPWYSGDVNKYIQFTLAQAIPANGVLVLNNAYNATAIGATISSYASNTATTATETVTMSEGSDGTDLGDVANAISGNTNSIQRALLGSNNWADSALRQYINANKAAGSVWTPKTKWDRPPSWASTTDGLLYGMDEDFLGVIGDVTKVTALNTISDGGGSVTTTEKFFLVSRTEVYGGNENNIAEGVAYPYYSDYSDLSAPGTGDDSNRIKYRNGSAKYWWLRSPYSGSASNVRYVSPSGGVSNVSATGSSGVAPACCII